MAKDIIQVSKKEELISLDAIYGLADMLRLIPESRRTLADLITDTLHDFVERGGIILSGEGEEIQIYPGIVDDVHGEDGSYVWVSEQRKRGPNNPPMRRPRRSILQRLQLYDAVARIKFGRSIVGSWEKADRGDEQ